MAKRMAYVRKKEKRKGKALTRQTLEQKKYHILLTNLPQESFDGQQVYELCLSQDFVGDFFLDRFFWLYMVL